LCLTALKIRDVRLDLLDVLAVDDDPSFYDRDLVLELVKLLMGFALPNDNVHAPNEKFHLPNFYKGIETSIWFLWEIFCKAKGQEHSPVLCSQTVESRQIN